MKTIYYLKNAQIVNEGRIFFGNILIEDGIIDKIFEDNGENTAVEEKNPKVIDVNGAYLLPGIIDDQVHFREPGLTSKADIYTESKAAVAGGVTSFMEMPNTFPNATTNKLLEDKYKIASEKSLANYSFYLGATNENIDEILKTDPATVCGLKIFMGASTGNMLVDNIDSLNEIFSKTKMLVSVHCEDEEIIRGNIKLFKDKYGEDVPIFNHPLIRSEEACYKSSALAVTLAKKHNTRLHLLHLSTAKELDLLDNSLPLEKKKITAEVCVHYLWFNNTDYQKMGTLIKWNPAIKTINDQEALLNGLLDDRLDVLATDHAPHKLEEKQNTYFKAPSGGPLIQHSLLMMLDFYQDKKITIEKIVEKMCHAPAICFRVKSRGFIREGYCADLTIVDTNAQTKVNSDSILYKCGWSLFEGHTFNSKITHTFVNGNLVYENGVFDETKKGRRLFFDRNI